MKLNRDLTFYYDYFHCHYSTTTIASSKWISK